jgi:hypothetical protein
MMLEALLEGQKVVHHITPDERTGDGSDVEGTGIDTAGCDEATFFVAVGGTNGTVDCHIEESDDNSNWADITDAEIVQIADDGDNVTASIGVRLGGRANRKRYLRAVLTIQNTKVADTYVLCLLRAQQAPVTNTPTSVLV